MRCLRSDRKMGAGRPGRMAWCGLLAGRWVEAAEPVAEGQERCGGSGMGGAWG